MLVHVMHSTVLYRSGSFINLFEGMAAVPAVGGDTRAARSERAIRGGGGIKGLGKGPATPSECDGARAGRRGSTPRAAGRRTKATKRSGACFSCQDGFGDMELGFSRQSKPKPSDSPQNGEAVRNNWNNSRLSLFRLTEPGNPLSTLKKLVLLDSWCWYAVGTSALQTVSVNLQQVEGILPAEIYSCTIHDHGQS